MVKYLKFHFLRAIESKKLILTIILLIVIGISGLVLHEFFFSSIENPKLAMLSMFNSYTQFFYLVLAYVIVSNFSDDIQSGAMTLFRYMGISETKVICSKLIYFVLLCLPLVDIIVLFATFMYGCDDVNFIFRALVVLDLSLVQVILLACVVSLFARKTSYATIFVYGLFLCFNVINLMGCGLTNQADSNSISTYFVQVASNQVASVPPTWDWIAECSSEQLFSYSVLVSTTWILLLFITTLIKAKRMK